MSSLVIFPTTPLLDQSGRLSHEWTLWFQNPNFITAKINELTAGTALAVTSGGTGTASLPANGQVLIGNGSGYVVANITPGTAIQITNSAGGITITNTGVTSLTGTANQIDVSSSTGAITLSTPQNIGTGSSPTFASLTTTAGITTAGGAVFHTTNTALTNGAGAGAGSITNAPAAGNPTKWIGINDNGTTRYIPAW